MRRNLVQRIVWGALWRSNNYLDGQCFHIINEMGALPALFRTRREAREFIEKVYGYIRTRPDLKAEPHGWKMPITVRLQIRVTTEPLREPA